MTTANMKLVTVEVLLDNQLESPDQHLDEGEAIVRRVIALDDLNSELKCTSLLRYLSYHIFIVTTLAYSEKVGCQYTILPGTA